MEVEHQKRYLVINIYDYMGRNRRKGYFLTKYQLEFREMERLGVIVESGEFEIISDQRRVY